MRLCVYLVSGFVLHIFSKSWFCGQCDGLSYPLQSILIEYQCRPKISD